MIHARMSCFALIIWLSCQACVSLFDDDSFPSSGNTGMTMSITINQLVWVVVSIYDCLVKHALICLMMTVSQQLKHLILSLFNQKYQSVIRYVNSIWIVNAKPNALVTGSMSCCLHMTADSCTREFVWMEQFHQATTSTTTRMAVNGDFWVVLLQSLTVLSSMHESVGWWQFAKQLKHASNRCSINSINCLFPIGFVNLCAIKYFQPCHSMIQEIGLKHDYNCQKNALF